MSKEFLTIKEETKIDQGQEKKEKIKPEKVKAGLSRLILIILILIFIALNIWGYYLYRRGFFGISADVATSNKPESDLEKPDSVYMIPGP